ncbi:MAG: HAD hydrolase family protein [Candidatus Methanospirareceae archaeon]
MQMKEKTICFDLEGPLSPQDNAYEVMKLIGEEGASVFEVISRYDDIISLEGRKGYEPGDTLALIVPFFLLHDITEDDIRGVSARAKIIEGAKYLFEKLQAENWDIYIISTSYEQHAYNIGHKLGVSEDHIMCTHLSLKLLRNVLSKTLREKKALPKKYLYIIKKAEEDIIELYSHIDDVKSIVNRLDEFFFRQLPSLGFDIFTTRVIGGERKAEAIREIAEEKGIALRDVIAVGDSITDSKMLNEVATHDGVAVVFNGNEYAVPYANVGLASVDIRFLYLVCKAFERGGKGAVMDMVTNWEDNRSDFEANPVNIPDSAITINIRDFITNRKGKIPFPYFHNLERADEMRKGEIMKIHKQLRMQVREDAGKLG